MVLDAGMYLYLGGFDWVEDDITPSQFARALPVIYATWCLALPDCIDRIEELIEGELEVVVRRMGWSSEDILRGVFDEEYTIGVEEESKEVEQMLECAGCADDYSKLRIGVVDSTLIAFVECLKTRHKSRCCCETFPDTINFTPPPSYTSESSKNSDSNLEFSLEPADEELPIYSSSLPSEDEGEDGGQQNSSEIDITGRCNSYIATNPHIETQHLKDPFLEAAIILYRAQGRTWSGKHEVGEKLCATCFLRREEYLEDDGMGRNGEFPDVPEGFECFRAGKVGEDVVFDTV